MSRIVINGNVDLVYDSKTYQIYLFETNRKTGMKVWKNVGQFLWFYNSKKNELGEVVVVPTMAFVLKAGTTYFYRAPQRLGLHKGMIDSLAGFTLTNKEAEIVPLEYCYFPQIQPKTTKGTPDGSPIYDGCFPFSQVSTFPSYALFGNSVEYWVPLTTWRKQTINGLIRF